MKISSNLHAMSTYSDSYVNQNKTNSKKNETDKLNVSKENFCNDRIVTAQGARTAEECGLVTGKNFANKITVAGADGSIFTVSSYYDASGNNSLSESYETVLQKKANGEEVSNFDIYMANLTADITSYFSTASSLGNDMAEIRNKISDVLAEISLNIQSGKNNPLADLQTTLNINGVNWKFSEIMKTMSVMEQGLGNFKTTLSLDYSDYAKMGVAIGFANTYAKENLNEEQSSYVNCIMQAKTNYLVQRQNDWVASNLSGGSSEVNGNLTGREKYYSLGSYKIATDMDLANEIKDIFSNIDYLDENTFSNALQRYKDILRPIKLSDGTDVSKISQILQKNASSIGSMYIGCLNTLSGIKNSGKIEVSV